MSDHERIVPLTEYKMTPRRRSTDAHVVLHARAEDYPPSPEEIVGKVGVRVGSCGLNPHGFVVLPSGKVVEATCLGREGVNFVRAGAELDPKKVKFSH